MIIDAHTHLWKAQTGRRDNAPVRSLKNGRSDFGGEIRQMMPPYMLTGENSSEMLISNMDYAGVSGAVIVGEVMDGNQDEYFKA
ncbi:MAG: amidohydrolase, partial [Eubacterium sp.]|nr:amidohydrolase [Eubacterium sp.]